MEIPLAVGGIIVYLCQSACAIRESCSPDQSALIPDGVAANSGRPQRKRQARHMPFSATVQGIS